MPATSFGGSMNVMICVDDFLRYKIVRFLKKSDAPTALRNIITAYYIIPAGLTIGSVWLLRHLGNVRDGLRWGRAIYPCSYSWCTHIILITCVLGST